MRRMVAGVVSMAFLMFYFGTVVGQQKRPADAKSPSVPAIRVPKPGPEMEKLNVLVGTWNTVEKHEPSEWLPGGGEKKGTDQVRLGPGGLSIISDYQSSGRSLGDFSSHNLTTWDPVEKLYKLFSVDNRKAGGSVMTGRWTDKNLVFTSEQKSAETKMKLKMTLTDLTPASYTTIVEVAIDDGPMKRTAIIKHTKK